jgi:ActR/RegA family two-component response regulator
MGAKHLLIVEPDRSFRNLLAESVRALAGVDAVTDFPTARQRLRTWTPDFVVTNLRLGEFNGLHLVYLLADTRPRPCGVVYSGSRDVALARDVRAAGAFWELKARVRDALPTYLAAALPGSDRRDPLWIDRRTVFRGGRRAADAPGFDPRTPVFDVSA